MCLRRKKVLDKQIGAISGKDEGQEKDDVAASHQAYDGLKRHGRQPIDYRQSIEGQIDANGIEHEVAEEGIGSKIDECVLDPPQIPHQGRVVAAVAGYMRGELEDQRVSEDEGQEEV